MTLINELDSTCGISDDELVFQIKISSEEAPISSDRVSSKRSSVSYR